MINVSWSHFPHNEAAGRAYRWGEDGLLGVCDTEARLCLSLALWNGQDPILKERLYGLTGPEVSNIHKPRCNTHQQSYSTYKVPSNINILHIYIIKTLTGIMTVNK